MTPATERKRAELLTFVDRVLQPEPSVQGVIGIGSIASGRMRPDSDIDAVVFLDPMDWYVIPGEFIWRSSDGTFHSIFTKDADVLSEGVEFDIRRLSLREWAEKGYNWPEGSRAEFSQGWLAFDRHGEVERLIRERTAYPESLREQRLDEAITWLDQHLGGDGPAVRWNSLGPVIAHDRLQAAYHYLVAGLFAYNRAWRPWRNRQMDSLLSLAWLPEKFQERNLAAACARSSDYGSYLKRAESLRELGNDLSDRLVADGFYSAEPAEQAFVRSHREPGYAWSMDEWNARNSRRKAQALSTSGTK